MLSLALEASRFNFVILPTTLSLALLLLLIFDNRVLVLSSCWVPSG